MNWLREEEKTWVPGLMMVSFSTTTIMCYLNDYDLMKDWKLDYVISLV